MAIGTKLQQEMVKFSPHFGIHVCMECEMSLTLTFNPAPRMDELTDLAQGPTWDKPQLLFSAS